MTQKSDILNYMLNGNRITPLEALRRFGCFRLSAIIFDLKEDGYDIKTEIVTNGRKHFAEYSLVTKIDENNQLNFLIS